MNCETIDAILDEHRTARLDQAERQAVATHLGGCPRCSASWAVHDALLGESMGELPPELIARAFGRVPERRAQARAGRRRSAALAATAAVAAVAAVAATFSLIGPTFATIAVTFNAPTVAMIAAALSLNGPDTSRGELAVPGGTATIVAAPPVFVAGRDYEVLSLTAAAPAAVDRIPVIEFFMYPCGHCYTLEEELTAWEAREQTHVALTRVPVMFNREAELHARAFYTAEVLGIGDEIHTAFYEEIHTRGNALASSEALAELFQRFGIDAATFGATFVSREVNVRVQRAVVLNHQYGISAVPSFVVGGRYSTRTWAVADYLVAEEAIRGAAAWLQRTNQAAAPPSLGDLLREVTPDRRIEDYSRLLEAAASPDAPPFVELALERARAGLSPEQVAEAERRYRERRQASPRSAPIF